MWNRYRKRKIKETLYKQTDTAILKRRHVVYTLKSKQMNAESYEKDTQ